MQVGFIGSGNMAAALARDRGEPGSCSDAGPGRGLAALEGGGMRTAPDPAPGDVVGA